MTKTMSPHHRMQLLLIGLISGLISLCVLPVKAQIAPSTTAPQVADGAQIFPPTTVFYLEIRRPQALLDSIWNHPLRAQIEELEQVKAYLKSPQIGPARLVLGLIESQLEMTWTEMIDALTAGGIYIGLDSKSQGIMFAAQGRDGESISKVVKALLGWVDLDAANKKQARPYEAAQHRTHRMIHFAGGSIARVNDWFLASNQRDLLTQSMDRMLDASPRCLAELPRFVTARKQRAAVASSNTTSNLSTAAANSKTNSASSKAETAPPTAWAYADLTVIRAAGLAPQLFTAKSDNPLAELLVGGLLEGLQSAEYVTAAVDHSADQITLDIQLPFAANKLSAPRQFFVTPQPADKQKFLVTAPATIAHISGLRDLGAWWHAKEDLFDEGIIAQLALADSQFSTLFASLDFGEEVLTAFEPGLQLVVAEQNYDAAQPDLKLPAIALVGRLKDPAVMKRRLRIAFQSVIGFVNIQSSMEGMPPLDLLTESKDGIEVSAADYVLDSKSPQGIVQLNLSPAIAFVDDFIVISSGKQLAIDLANSAAKSPQALPADANLLFELQGKSLVQALENNRDTLIAQNMLEQGSKREAAEQAVGDLIDILKLFDRLHSQISVEPESMRWQIDLSWHPNAGNAARSPQNK